MSPLRKSGALAPVILVLLIVGTSARGGAQPDDAGPRRDGGPPPVPAHIRACDAAVQLQSEVDVLNCLAQFPARDRYKRKWLGYQTYGYYFASSLAAGEHVRGLCRLAYVEETGAAPPASFEQSLDRAKAEGLRRLRASEDDRVRIEVAAAVARTRASVNRGRIRGRVAEDGTVEVEEVCTDGRCVDVQVLDRFLSNNSEILDRLRRGGDLPTLRLPLERP